MEQKIVWIDIEELHPHPDNPRKEIGDVTELADSIKKKGILQNLTVVKRDEGGYTVIIGHRRTEAARQAGFEKLPCVIAEMTPAEQVQTMLLENMQRADLTVYEQAEGFQMMLDFGFSADDVARETGFSKTTVRRRLKMAELDKQALKESAIRQPSIGDYDKLAQVEDVKRRNELLKCIGTSNFNWEIGRELTKQEFGKRIKGFLVYAKQTFGAKKGESGIQWGGKYERMTDDIDVTKWDAESTITLKKRPNGEVLYLADEVRGTVVLYTPTKEAPKVKRPQEEIDKEKRMKQAHADAEQIERLMYQLRQEYIKGLAIVTKAQKEACTRALLKGTIVNAVLYNYTSSNLAWKEVVEAFGQTCDMDGYCSSKDKEKILGVFTGDCPAGAEARIVALHIGDRPEEGFRTDYKGEFPKFRENIRLKVLYEWLENCGYVMSDAERQMMDGTHEVFTRT